MNNKYEGMTNKEKLILLDSIADDLPNGAYMAMAEEMGIDWEDIANDPPEGYEIDKL